MSDLEIYQEYTREEAHNVLSPSTRFTPNTGSWGLHGIVAIREQPGNYVFFVTFGRQQGEHVFDEWVTTDGVISWQSQPRQDFKDKTIENLIHHDEQRNDIYLLLRTSKSIKYTYLGRLKYLAHHPKHENPVWIYWQIMDWPIPIETLEKMNLVLKQIQGGVKHTIQEAIGDYQPGDQKNAVFLPSFRWNHRKWEVDLEILFNQIRSSITLSLPDEATRFRDWYVEVDGHAVSPKWVFNLITDASYNTFDAPTARDKLSQIGIQSYRVKAREDNRGYLKQSISEKDKPKRKISEKALPSHEHEILDRKITEIQRYLCGEATAPTDEILCEWVAFCYTFELFNEGIRLFQLIDPHNVNEWYYTKTKKIARICEIKNRANGIG